MSAPLATESIERGAGDADALPAAPRWRALRHLLANPLSALGLLLACTVLVVGLAAPLLSPYDPIALEPANRLAAPDWSHWLGTDEGGRDILSRIIHGTRSSLIAALAILAAATVVGTAIGLAAGWLGGWVDEVLMRITDMFLAFPALVLAMGVAAALGPSLLNAVLATAVVWWPWYARLVRGQTLSLKQQTYVEAARVSGASATRIVTRHILRNCWTPVVVQMSLDVGYAILTLSGLSFIGLGAQPPTAEWGAMVSAGRDYFLDQWWIVTYPGLAIFISVMAFNLLGDGLQEAFTEGQRR